MVMWGVVKMGVVEMVWARWKLHLGGEVTMGTRMVGVNMKWAWSNLDVRWAWSNLEARMWVVYL